MNICIFDIETDGLEDYTKIHCASFNYFDGSKWVKYTATDYKTMRKLFSRDNITYVGHNIIFYDIPVVEEILNIKFPKNIIDTLFLSQYLYDSRERHSLESWGEELGYPKIQVEDEEWKILSDSERERYERDPYIRKKYMDVVLEVMVPRCERDVTINTKLYEKFTEDFKVLYKGGYSKFNRYLHFLISNIDLQVRNKWQLDVELLETNLQKLLNRFISSKTSLEEELPKVEKTRKKSKPKVMYKKDGSLSHWGEKWAEDLNNLGLPPDHEEDIQVHKKWEDPNANSTDQIKDWLYSHGWKPDYYKFYKNVDGETNMVPQVKKDGELTDSVKVLIPKEPKIQLLEDYTIVKSRKEDLERFYDNMDNRGKIKAEIGGITSTLRARHKTIVNLPGVHKVLGEEVRGVLVASEGNILCGSDLTSLEDRCKQHWIKPYDPEYVDSMSDPFYDPHLDLAIMAGDISEEEVNFYKYLKEPDKFPKERVDKYLLNLPEDKSKKVLTAMTDLRRGYKTVNYSATYGVGVKTLSRSSGKSQREAKKMLEVFHKRNWATKEVEKNAQVITYKGQKWVLNEVNGFWYPLRSEKDIFSALNQGLGAYIFNMWIYFQRKKGIKEYVGQFHDEVALDILNTEQNKKRVEKILHKSIGNVNKSLSLNVDMSCDVQFGYRYSEIH